MRMCVSSWEHKESHENDRIPIVPLIYCFCLDRQGGCRKIFVESRYAVDKYILLRYSSRPYVQSMVLPKTALRLLHLAFLLFVLARSGRRSTAGDGACR